jgi:hypothetical protein
MLKNRYIAVISRLISIDWNAGRSYLEDEQSSKELVFINQFNN